jgi:hypothetical protein
MGQGANRITLAGLPIASQLGRPRVLALAEETARKDRRRGRFARRGDRRRVGHVGARRIAIASRWSEQLNGALLSYLKQA